MSLARPLPDKIDKTCDINTMLQLSNIVYTTATLRSIVREHEKTVDGNENKEHSVAFEKPELVWTQEQEEDTNPFEGTFLKHIIKAEPLVEFIKLNEAYLTDEEGELAFNHKGDSTIKPTIVKQLENLEEAFDGDMIEYDDEFVEGVGGTELVYSIIVDRSRKRVVVVFRGSAALKDFIVDARIIKKTTPQIEEFAGRKVDVHRGFSNYLFGKTRDSQGRSKFTQIVDILKQVFSYKDDAKGYDYSGYDLFITGHSLGGGLAQLLAFVLAGSKESKDFVPTPVKAISFASPCVGDKHFYKKYLEFEKEGKLRHLRVSNEGDVVACVPSVGYRQTGLNLHGVPGRMIQVKYRNNKKSSLLQFGLSFVSKHSLNSYSERLFTDENADIVNKTTMELYDEYADM